MLFRSELDALVMCELSAPLGSFVRQSPFNGKWCIYEKAGPEPRGDRLWERRGRWSRPEGWAVTTSLDAALALADQIADRTGMHAVDVLHQAIDAMTSTGWKANQATGPQLARWVVMTLLSALQPHGVE